MSNQLPPDPERCWLCGQKGSPVWGRAEGILQCIYCDVTWSQHELDNHGQDKTIIYQGSLIDLVDHTEPGSLGSPA